MPESVQVTAEVHNPLGDDPPNPMGSPSTRLVRKDADADADADQGAARTRQHVPPAKIIGMVEIGVAEETEEATGAVGENGEEQEEEEGDKNESEESEEEEEEDDGDADFIDDLVEESRQRERRRKRVICIFGLVKFLSNLWIFTIRVPKLNFVF